MGKITELLVTMSVKNKKVRECLENSNFKFDILFQIFTFFIYYETVQIISYLENSPITVALWQKPQGYLLLCVAVALL